jgi:tetratricopeptide (TPR) repeat protein
MVISLPKQFTSSRSDILSRAGKPPLSGDPDPDDHCSVDRRPVDLRLVDLRRRKFLIRFCQGAGVALIPRTLWGIAPAEFPVTPQSQSPSEANFQIHPHYRSDRPLDAVLHQVQAGHDEFITENYADQIAAIFTTWSADLLKSASETQSLARYMAPDFHGTSLHPTESRVLRSSSALEVRSNRFAGEATLGRDDFLREMQSSFSIFSRIAIAEFQITSIHADPEATSRITTLRTRVRYEITGTGEGLHRAQRIGNWEMTWLLSPSGEFQIRRWQALDETQAKARSPIFVDIANAALGKNSSYSEQMMHGTDYWRTVLDSACGIDVYGHNGISVADIDNDGFDDLYVCQPAGLPNRLYRNRGDGTFEDITEASGLGILENTACALFADFNNDGRQHAIVVRADGPSLFLNEGGGKFRERLPAFQFANPPQGTFTGAAVADYDRDGWLDIYFCLYSYYQGTGQYKYPSPYHDAENGPPNFLMRNQRDGTFRDVTAASGLNQNNTRYSFCCGWSDYNHDGWPDLCVVNDFGRKNLYGNNGDGTFTDVAAHAGVEDVGAGMSVSWLDYDNDGFDDLYIANMWTAAGERISTQGIFKNTSTDKVRALFQKHAMGNSLFRNRGARVDDAGFEDATRASGAGIGRWSWSSDTFDFDHDGFADLYVANGMISGLLRADLNSFFWRQVVARSPDEAAASREYEQGWSAINELIRADGTWSGYERNIFYANNRDGTFSDVSAAVGLDFVEDGRAFALADFDHDGRLEVFLKNRNAPQLRIARNVISDLPPSISFRLQGTKSNRDAIGAAVTIKSENGIQTRLLQAGSGFLSQHSKDVFFGLGKTKDPVHASIRWPSGLVQEVHDLPANHRVWVLEGSHSFRLEPFRTGGTNSMPIAPALIPASAPGESFPENIETWLLAPISAPEFSLNDLLGQPQLLPSRGKAMLLTLWITNSEPCAKHLRILENSFGHLKTQGLQCLGVCVDTAGHSSQGARVEDVRAFARDQRLSFPNLLASEDFLAVYNLLYRQLFDRHRDLGLPTSFLINPAGEIVKVYQGPINAQHLEQDFQRIPETDAERLALALPFPSSNHSLEVGRNYLSLGAILFQRGYLDQAESAFQQAFREDSSSAEALYGVGSVYLNQNKNAAAREVFERVVKLTANYPDTLPDAWNNLGVIATREGRVEDSVGLFQRALQLNPRHVLSLDNLGNAYRLEKHWDDARTMLERALQVAPQDADANYGLGMVFAQTGETDKAYEHLQRALQARPAYPEALNNLGILYLRTGRRNDAVAIFKQCIRVTPTFDQAYLNLARVYALEGARDGARGVLLDLLKQHPDHAEAKQMLEQLQ